MSGFVGFLNLDGSPVDRALLERMTGMLAFRGPDGLGFWCKGNMGLGHALFKTTRESIHERQPYSSGDRFWIVADARVDAREDLVARLHPELADCRKLSLETPDVELILAAYEQWGDSCLDRLLGDFSFVIWDAARQRLLCARDHFGVKPFYYAQIGRCLVFSNTLDCVRKHPAVSNGLNDLAIADFLLFDMNQDPSTTSFADIQRLPPAHVLVLEQGAVSVRRYWELGGVPPVHFRCDEEYIEHFRELLDTAVADRLRTESAGILMSGGLDSTTVAASAQRVFKRAGNPSGLHAYTEVFDDLIPHEERHYATVTATWLGIPIEYLLSDDRKIFEGADQPEYRTPEPANTAWPDTTRDQLRQAAQRCRVVLTGYGGDPALSSRITVHFRKLLRNGRFGRVIADTTRYLCAEGRLSRLYFSTRWRIATTPIRHSPPYPSWLDSRLENELGLKDRWKMMNGAEPAAPNCAVRPEAYAAITAQVWPRLFEAHDASTTKIPIEVRHPFFDLRFLSFLLGLPTLPWCSDKQLLREAACGVLPDLVRLRRKAPLLADPVVALLQNSDSGWVDCFDPVPELERYVVRNRIVATYKEKSSWAAWNHLKPLSLNFWLHYPNRVG